MIVFVLIPLLIAIVIAAAAYHAITGYRLARHFRGRWHPEGRFVLFVHSESPIWKDYLQREVIPKIERRSVFLNWSERNRWKANPPLEAKMLRHWGGIREFNPMAIIVAPHGRVKTVRMFKAFRDFKHGKSATLRKAMEQLSALIAATEQQFIGNLIAPGPRGPSDQVRQANQP